MQQFDFVLSGLGVFDMTRIRVSEAAALLNIFLRAA